MIAGTYDPQWRMFLTRQPSQAELAEVARRFVRSVAPNIPISVLDHVVETAVWNLCARADAGSLEVLDDDRDWKWPELEDHCQRYASFAPDIDKHAQENGQRTLEWARTLDLEYWLSIQTMTTLREWGRAADLPAARKKRVLVDELVSSTDRSQQIDQDFQTWKAEKVASAEKWADGRVVPAYRLLALTIRRLRAWGIVHLDSRRPEIAQGERRKRDKLFAREHFERIRGMSPEVEKATLKAIFDAELGPNWIQNAAAKRVFENQCRRIDRDSRATLDDLEKDSASFLRDLYWLELMRCPLCEHLGRELRITDPSNEKTLPPYHPSCECEVDWKNGRATEEVTPGPRFKGAYEEWAATHVKGLGVVPPTIRDMVAFAEAMMADEAESERTDNNASALDKRPLLARCIRAVGRFAGFRRKD